MRIFIIGSCVTRDAFSFFPHRAHTIIEYVARSSFAASFHREPFPIPAADLIGQSRVSSPFQRRMLEYDLSRALPELLSREATSTDLILVDFIDERFSLAMCDAIPATYSVAFQECPVERSFDLIASGSETHFTLWEEGFARFMSHARALALPVWVHAVHWGRQSRQAELYDAARIAGSNLYLDRLYGFAWDQGCTLIRPAGPPFLDPEHKWGSAPFHYERGYYETLISTLDAAE